MPTVDSRPRLRRDPDAQRRLSRLYCFLCFLWFGGIAPFSGRLDGVSSARAAEEPNAADRDFFENKIRPLLAEKCHKCHGAQDEPEGGLRLISRELVLRGGESGPAAVPGKPDESLLIRAVRYQDEPQMPPDEALSSDQRALLTDWVARGLPWGEPLPAAPAATDAKEGGTKGLQISAEQRRFWAFQPPVKSAPPAVHNQSWPQGDIDRFVLAKLEEAGLAPAPQVDKRTLIRRATFDLIGLPPAPEDVEAFLADDSPDAFAQVVERLLNSPQYGERWGRHWLDVVRYADSFDARIVGSDNVMDCNSAWRYRDWVVSAFNRDLPYDQFMIHQVAGDLLPAADGSYPNLDGVVATGMLALGNWGGGDADKEKLLTDVADDQVDVVARGFLGLTLGCARCHDHKFDPLSMEDYYGLAGIFFSSHILADPGPKTNGPPMLRVSLETSALRVARESRERKMADLKGNIDRLETEGYAALAGELASQVDRYLIAAWDYERRPPEEQALSAEAFAARHGLQPFALAGWLNVFGGIEGRPLDQPVKNPHGLANLFAWKGSNDTPSLTVNVGDQEASFVTIKMPPRSVAVHPSPTGGVAVAWRSPVNGSVRVSGRVADADGNCGNGVAWSLEARRGPTKIPLARGAIDNGGKQEFSPGESGAKLDEVTVRVDDLLQLAIEPKGEYACDTTLVDLAIEERATPASGGSAAAPARAWNLAADVVKDPLENGQGNPHSDSHGNADVWHFHDLSGGPATLEFAADSPWERWRTAATGPDVSRAQAVQEATTIRQQIAAGLEKMAADDQDPAVKAAKSLLGAGSPFWGKGRQAESLLAETTRQTLAALRNELASLEKNPPAEAGYANGCLEGGCPQSPHAGTHDVHVHLRGRYDRLGNLVPRRFPLILAGEQQTPIAQGSGRWQLAQWLASSGNPLTARVMVNRIWQFHFGEGIVRTPGNFGKLGERPTHSELLDYCAAAFVESGWSIKQMHRQIMLSATYQQSSIPSPESAARDPDNRLWGRMNRRRLEAEAVRDSLLAASGSLDLARGGPAVRDFASPRRTLYLTTIRSDRSSFRELFDAADPTAMVHQRTISTVAPQALFMLNDPFALEQSRRLARQALEQPPDDAGRVGWLYQRLFARPAEPAEIELGQALLTQARQSAEKADPDAEERAWQGYCQTLLCTSEFMFVD